jgi:hypothetical protein
LLKSWLKKAKRRSKTMFLDVVGELSVVVLAFFAGLVVGKRIEFNKWIRRF